MRCAAPLMKHRIVATAVLVFAGIWLCPISRTSAQAPVFSEGQGSRHYTAIAWDTLWVYSSDNDEVAAATSLVPDNQGGVFFADPFLLQVHHVDAQGRLAWSWGREGSGPGEIRDLRPLALDNSGNLVLADSRNRRIVTINADGEMLREVPLQISAATVFEIVVLESGHYLMYTDDSDHPWVLVDQMGTGYRSVAPPQSFQRFSVLQRAGRIAKWRDERWVFAFQVGNGWFTFQEETLTLSSPYVEHTDFSENPDRLSNATAPSSASLSVRGDTLAVLFAGKTRGWLRHVDRYELNSGSYVDSFILPEPMKNAVVDERGAFFVTTYDDVPRLLALRPQPLYP